MSDRVKGRRHSAALPMYRPTRTIPALRGLRETLVMAALWACARCKRKPEVEDDIGAGPGGVGWSGHGREHHGGGQTADTVPEQYTPRGMAV